MTEEIWKDIAGYENYQISSEGRVKSLARKIIDKNGREKNFKERILKATTDKRGYKTVILYRDLNNKKQLRVHRLVCEAFHPNPDNKPQVNHIDEDKANNRACNLEWSTCSENTNYGTRNARVAKALSKPVAQYTIGGELVKIWDSTMEAARQGGFDYSYISKAALGKRKTAYKCIWKYISEEDKSRNLELSTTDETSNYLKNNVISNVIGQYTLEGKLVKVWNSPIDVERSEGFDRSSISKVARGKRKTAYNYIWKYINEEDEDYNLELYTLKENNNHRANNVTTRKIPTKPVAQYTLDDQLVKVWNSPIEAERKGGFNRSNISAVAKGKRKTTGGYIWKYVSQ